MVPGSVPDEMWGTTSKRQVFVSDQTPQVFISELERRMRPGECSEAGFLGPSERLLDRLSADDDWLRRHRITHEQIADRLETVIGVARRLLHVALRTSNQSVIVYDRFEVEFKPSCGYQECPFSLTNTLEAGTAIEWCGYAASNFVICDRATKRSMSIPELAIHLIRDHHFFEGDTPYRVDPDTVVALLEIEPNVHYAPKTASAQIWSIVESSSTINEEFVTKIEMAAESRAVLDGGVAYRIGDELVLVIRQHLRTGTFPVIDGRTIAAPWQGAGITRFRKDVETFHIETPWKGLRADA